MTTNPINAFKTTNHNTKHTNNTNISSKTNPQTKTKQIEHLDFILYYISKIYNSYFVYSIIYSKHHHLQEFRK